MEVVCIIKKHPNLTVGKVYIIDNKPKISDDYYYITNDIENKLPYSKDQFMTVDVWREMKINNII